MISREWEDFFFFKHVPSSRWIMLLIILFREKIHNFGLIQEKLARMAMLQYVTEVRAAPCPRSPSSQMGQTTTPSSTWGSGSPALHQCPRGCGEA